MKKQANTVFILGSIILFLLSQHAIAKNHEEVENEREFEYTIGSEKGPGKWGELKKEWEACKNGKLQSPIDMTNKRVKIISKEKDLFISYKPAQAQIINRGHDISVAWKLGEAGSIKINGTKYFLKQSHWHSPSEHYINGKRFDMELHMVHQTKNEKQIAAIGVLYKIGAPDPFLTKLLSNMSGIPLEKEEKNVGEINPKQINMGSFYYYRYIGSLTIPPCTEGVIWTINKKVRTVSREQLQLLRAAVHDDAQKNARPLQFHSKRERSTSTGNNFASDL